MNIPTYIGIRFLTGRSDSAFLSFITRVSMIGLTLGVIALIVVVSVMNGFDSQLKYRILGAVPHVLVKGGEPTDVESLPGVQGGASFLKRNGILVQSRTNRVIAVYGIVPEYEDQVSVIPQHMSEGVLSDLVAGSYNIIIGKSLAAQLGLWLDDSITLLIPEPSKGGAMIVPKFAKVQLSGTFELQSELDYSLVLIHLEDLKQILGRKDNDYRITLQDIFGVSEITQLLGNESEVSDWTQEYGDFFDTVRMEKSMMFVLLTLVVMIAAFNTVSGLSMMVKDKQAEIAVLRTMGLSRARIMQLFIIQGGIIGLIGTAAGVVLGIPLAYNITEVVGFFENLFGSRMLAGTYFDQVPSDVRFVDIIVIILVSFLISILATLYPAYRAARIEPATVLRAE